MDLIIIECCVCGDRFFVKNETGDNNCPRCNAKNERYVFDKDMTKEKIELVGEIHKEIRDVFDNHGMDDISNIKIVDLILGK